MKNHIHILAVGLALAFQQGAQAQFINWASTSDTNWGTAANWAPATVPNNIVHIAQIGVGTTTGTIDLGGNTYLINKLNFISGGTPGSYTVQNGTLNINANSAAIQDAINVAGSGSTVSANLNLSNSLGGRSQIKVASGSTGFTVSGNITSTTPIGLVANTGTLIISGNISSNTDVVVNGSNVLQFTGQKKGSGQFQIYSGTAQLGRSGGPVFSSSEGGLVNLIGGTLQLAANNQIDLRLYSNGGTFDLNSYSNTSSAVLDLANNSIFDFSDAAAESLSFADSAARVWTSGKILTINGFTSGQDSLRFGTSAVGLTLGQLAQIKFNGSTDAQIDSLGYVTPVPEPGTWALLAMSLTTVVILRRRKVA